MPSALNYTREQLCQEALEDVRFLEEVGSRHPKWMWPGQLMPLAREFVAITSGPPPRHADAVDFARRLREHVTRERLKGLDDMVWRAEAFAEVHRTDEKGA